MTNKINNLIKLVKENNQRNNAEIVSQLLALKIKFEELEEQISILDNQVNSLALDLDIAREENQELKAVNERQAITLENIKEDLKFTLDENSDL